MNKNIKEDLSVIVPTYNHAEYIEQCLTSILNQKTTYLIHVYILDDCSDDGTTEICRKIQASEQDRITHLISPHNLGSGKASHYFHKPNIKGRYWAILEGDDHWISMDKVQRQLDLMEVDRSLVGTAHAVEIFDQILNSTRLDTPELGTFSFFEIVKNRKTVYHYAHTSTWIWRHLFHKSGHYFPPRFAEPSYQGDTVLFALMTRGGGKVCYLNGLLSRYNFTGRGTWSKSSSEERKSNIVDVEKKFISLLPIHQRSYLRLSDEKFQKVGD